MTVKGKTVVLTSEEAAKAQLTDYRKSELDLALESAGYTLIIEDKASK